MNANFLRAVSLTSASVLCLSALSAQSAFAQSGAQIETAAQMGANAMMESTTNHNLNNAAPTLPTLQQVTPQAPAQVNVQSTAQSTAQAAPAIDPRFAPRVYGGAPAQPAQPTAPSVHTSNTVTPNDTSGGYTGTYSGTYQSQTPAVTAAPKWPVDFSDQYTETIAGVPIIENPTSCGQNPLELRFKVHNIGKSEGNIVADLHDDVQENFLVWDKVVLRIRAAATEGTTEFCMPLPKPGDYAVAFYHDKNGNKEFDKGFLGIPKERFGMSTNPKFGLSSPKYEDVVFTVGEESLDMEIHMKKASDVI